MNFFKQNKEIPNQELEVKNGYSLFIKREDLYNLVEKLFVDEKEKYKKYIFEKLEEDFGEIDEEEVNQIFDDMQDDSEMICKRITEIIDEHQVKKGYY